MKINACSEQIQLDNLEMVIGKITKPVILEIWNGRQKDSVIRREYPYTKVTQTDDGLKAYARIEDEWAGTTEVTDIYRVEEEKLFSADKSAFLRKADIREYDFGLKYHCFQTEKMPLRICGILHHRLSMIRTILMRMDMRIIFIQKERYSGMTALIIRCLPATQRKQRKQSA